MSWKKEKHRISVAGENMKVYLFVMFATLILFAATTLGAFGVFLLRKINPVVERVCMGLASGIMLAASIFSLLLPALETSSCMMVILSFLVGGVILWLLDSLFTWKNKQKSLFFLAVTLHNIPEGMAVGLACTLAFEANSSVTIASAIALTIGIAIQNIPEGMAVSFAMMGEEAKKRKAFFYGVLSGIVEPIFGLLMAILSHQLQSSMPIFLSLAAGTMFYVVVDELIPSSKKENSSAGVVSFMLGFVIMMYLDVVLG